MASGDAVGGAVSAPAHAGSDPALTPGLVTVSRDGGYCRANEAIRAGRASMRDATRRLPLRTLAAHH
jgi:hypothetical protein